MLAGKAYGDKPCEKCGSHKATLYDECFFCGEDGCSECMNRQGDEGGAERLICGQRECLAKAPA